MKLHEALRQLFAKYGGRVMDEDAHFDIMGWLSDRQVFDSYPSRTDQLFLDYFLVKAPAFLNSCQK